MQARPIGRPNAASQARLQLILILLAAWNLGAFLLLLSDSRFLSVAEVGGFLGARSLGGSMAVLAIAYLYAARNPVRYRFVLWLASLEQFMALFTGTFYWARGTVEFGEAAVPILVAAVFLVLLLINLPRQTDSL
jgi:hypothetical protein